MQVMHAPWDLLFKSSRHRFFSNSIKSLAIYVKQVQRFADILIGLLEYSIYVTRFVKTQHNDAFLEFQIFAPVSFMYLKLCSVAISMLYC